MGCGQCVCAASEKMCVCVTGVVCVCVVCVCVVCAASEQMCV